MPYLTAIKIVAALAIVIAWNVGLYRYGYNARDQLATIADQKQQIETAVLNKQVSEEQAKNSAYAEFIESDYNDKVNEINKLSGDLRSALSVPTKRKICKSRLPEASDTKASSTEANESEFSPEFIEFLESEKLRLELEKLLLDDRYRYLMHLCKTGQAVCLKEGK